ncbi:MAG: hypothetical protein ACN4E2_06610 [Nitrospinota bacterium]
MSLVWAVIVLLAIGLVGGQLIFSKEKLPELLRYLFITGWEFILVGLLLGPIGFDILTVELLDEGLAPFISVGLIWIGLLVGIQLDKKQLYKLEEGLIKFIVAESLISTILIFMLAFALFYFMGDYELQSIFAAAIAIGTAGAVSSSIVVSLMHGSFPITARVLIRKISIICNLNPIIPLLIVGITFPFLSGVSSFELTLQGWIYSVLFSLIAAIAIAIIFLLFDFESIPHDEGIAILLGFISFTAGVAIYLNISALFLGLLVGAILASAMKKDDKLYGQLLELERPFYIVMLLIAGAQFGQSTSYIVAIAIGITLFRIVIKNFELRGFGQLFMPKFSFPPKVSFAFASSGAISIAIGLGFNRFYSGELATIVFNLIVIMMIINDIVAPFLLRNAVSSWVAKLKR